MIQFEKEVLRFLNLPSIPVKKWDGESSFEYGVAIVTMYDDREAYAVATFDSEKDEKPRIKKTFSIEQFFSVKDIFVVPSYMNVDINHSDVDAESKEAMERMAEEAEELENEGVEEEHVELPENEWCFDEIHNLEEAVAWLKSYNQTNRIRGKVPSKEEPVKLRLLTIWREKQDKGNE